MAKQILIFILLLTLMEHSYSQNEIQTFKTNCDSVYKSKGYKIILQYFSDGIKNVENKNTIFSLVRSRDSKEFLIIADTIFSKTGEIEFRDFNNDKVKDILVQNISDVRSNWTYYLYLIDTLHNKLRKIKGFEEIKNPNYLPEYNLIDNYVVSGTNWTSFYKIKHGKIVDYGVVVYADASSEDDSAYEIAYKKALKKILAKEKNNR